MRHIACLDSGGHDLASLASRVPRTSLAFSWPPSRTSIREAGTPISASFSAPRISFSACRPPIARADIILSQVQNRPQNQGMPWSMLRLAQRQVRTSSSSARRCSDLGSAMSSSKPSFQPSPGVVSVRGGSRSARMPLFAMLAKAGQLSVSGQAKRQASAASASAVRLGNACHM